MSGGIISPTEKKVLSSFDYLKAGELLNNEVEKFRKSLREFLDREKIGKVAEFFEKNEFPEFWL